MSIDKSLSDIESIQAASGEDGILRDGDDGNMNSAVGLFSEILPENFSDTVLSENYGEVSALSKIITDEPGLMLLAARESILSDIEKCVFDSVRNEYGCECQSNFKGPENTAEDSSENKAWEPEDSDRVKCDGSDSLNAFCHDERTDECGTSYDGLYSEDFSFYEAETEISSSDILKLPADASSSDEVENFRSSDVFALFREAEKASLAEKSSAADNSVWCELSTSVFSKNTRKKNYSDYNRTLQKVLNSLIANARGRGTDSVSARDGKKHSVSQHDLMHDLIRLDSSTLSIIREYLMADGLSVSAYRGIKFVLDCMSVSACEEKNDSPAGDIFYRSRDPFLAIKLDEYLTHAFAEDFCSDGSSDAPDGSQSDSHTGNGTGEPGRCILNRIYHHVFRDRVIKPRNLPESADVEFINGYTTEIVLARVVFAVMSAAERAGMDTVEYLDFIGTSVKDYEKLKTESLSVSDSGSETDVSRVRTLENLLKTDITGMTSYMKLNASAPENLLRLRIMDRLVDTEISGRKYDGAMYEMAGNLQKKGLPVLWAIKLLLNSQTGDIKNKTRTLKNNLRLLFDDGRFRDMTGIRRRSNETGQSGNSSQKGRIFTNRKALTVRQERRFSQLVETSALIMAVSLFAFSEFELLFNDRSTLRYLMNAIHDFRIIKGGNSPEDSENHARKYSVKLRVAETSELSEKIRGLALRIVSAPRIELLYLAVFTAMTMTEPEECYVELLAKEFDRIIGELTSGRSMLVMQWRFAGA